MLKPISSNKKGMGVVSTTVVGVIALIFTVIVGYVLIETLVDANLIGKKSDGNESYLELSAENLTTNLTSGITNVALKVPTILLIVAVVFLFGALALLVLQARRMGMFGGGGGGF